MDTTGTTSRGVVAIIPTYNEPEDLRRAVDSLLSQEVADLHILIINAGDPLPDDIAKHVEEMNVAEDNFWAHCIKIGFDKVRNRGYNYVYLTNADTFTLPKTLQTLIDHAASDEKAIACAPAYIEEDGEITLLYSHQDPLGFLLYGRLIRPWTDMTDAPKDPFEIYMTGGQGVVFNASVLKQFNMDDVLFPHTAGDHDFWLVLGENGYSLTLLPQTGIVNTRILSALHQKGFAKKLKILWQRMTSDKTAESWRIMWRLRKKHLPWPIAVVSTVVSFGLRWTVGFPKILRRT